MGLDLTAYSGLKPVDCVFDANGKAIDPVTRDYIPGSYRPYINPDFEGREEGLQHQQVYTYQDSFRFSAGSCGRYNSWRNELAMLAGYAATPYVKYGTQTERHDAGAWAATEGPFWELINFSDCEGVIGPVVSAKLAKDFADFQDKADTRDEYFKQQYEKFRKGFELAANGGAVDFH